MWYMYGMGRERKRPKGAATFVATFRIGFSPSQRRKASARFNAGTALYNAVLREALDRARAMRADPRWQKARDLPRDHPTRKPLFNQARTAAGFDKGALASFGSRLRVGWLREGVAAQEAQALAERAYGAVAAWVYGPRGRPRFKAMARGVRSMSSKDRNGAIRLVATGRDLQWGRGLTAPLVVDPANPLHAHGLAAIDEGRVLSVRVVRRVIKGRDYYDAQLVCDGEAARRYAIHAGAVGLDLGPSTVAVVPEDGAFLEAFCDGLGRNEAEVRRVGRKVDRQHRAGSPDCFDAKGRHRTGRCPWVRSSEARVTAGRLVEAYRRKAEHRRSLHGNLTNRVLGQGTTIHVERLSKVAWQKMYGRSVGFRAPGMFETLLSRKAANAGGSVVLINPYVGRLSQRCVCGSVVKKPLCLRVHSCPCGVREQRDVWSAFLARHSSGREPDLAEARQELRRRQDVGGTPGSGGRTLRVPAACRLVPAAAGGAGGVA
jgi:putative transposase